MVRAEGDSESCWDRRNCRKDSLENRRGSVFAELRPKRRSRLTKVKSLLYDQPQTIPRTIHRGSCMSCASKERSRRTPVLGNVCTAGTLALQPASQRAKDRKYKSMSRLIPMTRDDYSVADA